MEAGDVVLLLDIGNRDFTIVAIGVERRKRDTMDNRRAVSCVPFLKSYDIFRVEIFPGLDCFGRGRFGEDDSLVTGPWEGFKGCFMAVVCFVLTDDDKIWWRREFSKRADAGRLLMSRNGELWVEYGRRSR